MKGGTAGLLPQCSKTVCDPGTSYLEDYQATRTWQQWLAAVQWSLNFEPHGIGWDPAPMIMMICSPMLGSYLLLFDLHVLMLRMKALCLMIQFHGLQSFIICNISYNSS
jgi:hypothetical protein